jgi:hypothetical protein
MGLIESAGPSRAAIRRMNRVLLCLVDADDSLRATEIKERLSDPMSRADLDSALRRLKGAHQVEYVKGDGKWRTTTKGRDVAVRLISDGASY